MIRRQLESVVYAPEVDVDLRQKVYDKDRHRHRLTGGAQVDGVEEEEGARSRAGVDQNLSTTTPGRQCRREGRGLREEGTRRGERKEKGESDEGFGREWRRARNRVGECKHGREGEKQS